MGPNPGGLITKLVRHPQSGGSKGVEYSSLLIVHPPLLINLIYNNFANPSTVKPPSLIIALKRSFFNGLLISLVKIASRRWITKRTSETKA